MPPDPKVSKLPGAFARREATESDEQRVVREDAEEIRKHERDEEAATSRSDLTDIIGNLFEAHNGPIISAVEHLTDEVTRIGSAVRRVVDSERINTRLIAGMTAKVEQLDPKLRAISAAINVISSDLARVQARLDKVEETQATQWRQIETLFRDTPNAKGDGDGDDAERRAATDGETTQPTASATAKKDAT